MLCTELYVVEILPRGSPSKLLCLEGRKGLHQEFQQGLSVRLVCSKTAPWRDCSLKEAARSQRDSSKVRAPAEQSLHPHVIVSNVHSIYTAQPCCNCRCRGALQAKMMNTIQPSSAGSTVFPYAGHLLYDWNRLIFQVGNSFHQACKCGARDDDVSAAPLHHLYFPANDCCP